MDSKKDVCVLGIESSCDETAASVVVNGRDVLSNVIASQIEIHKRFGGVVPEIASRKHIEVISGVVDEALEKAGKTFDDIDVIAVTHGPGLSGALLVGLSYAKALAFTLSKPLVGVHHIEGHISANYIENKSFAPPFICLVVSGGHTHIVHVLCYDKYDVLGKTKDDACGEAYDKVARAVGLGYPGGPQIDKAARLGNKDAISFPKVFLESGSLDFSFSGLKSAVLNYINKCNMSGVEVVTNDVAAAFQASAIEVLVSKTVLAAKATGVSKIALAGGVASNSALREEFGKACAENGFEFNMPSPIFCTDNAAMIACAGYFRYVNGVRDGLSLNAVPGLVLGSS